jgi:hypothetical protein
VIGIGVVALPQCWEHIPGPGGGAGPRLLIANGDVPRA